MYQVIFRKDWAFGEGTIPLMSQRRQTRMALLCLIIIACSPNVFAATSGITFVSDHMRLTAYFGEQEVRVVISDGTELVLPQVAAASGAKYTADSATFWVKDEEAVFEYNGETYALRVVDPLVDPWERAKRAGASFRAIGQEPGWILVIWDDERIELALDYGATEIKTPIGVMEIHYFTRTRIYRTVYPMSPLQLTVTIREQTCYDVMSGEGFPTTVEIAFWDETLYFGCGRYL